MIRTSRHPGGSDAASSARPSARGTSEEGSQLGCLGGMHHREDLISRLQHEVRARDQKLALADDGRQGTLTGQWQVTEGAANRLGTGMHLLFDQRIGGSAGPLHKGAITGA